MSDQTNTRIPAPIYAAAGAGDLAYQQLRKLPAVVAELRDKAEARTADLRQRAATGRVDLRERAVATLKAANATATDLRDRARDRASTADIERLREVALRNAAAVVASAQAVYTELVARGERVVGSGVVEAADVVNADLETTEAPAELPATQTATPATQPATPAAKPATPVTNAATPAAKTAPAKAVKRTRPAADK